MSDDRTPIKLEPAAKPAASKGYSQADKERAVDLLTTGASRDEVAAQLGVTKMTLWRWVGSDAKLAQRVHDSVKSKALVERGANLECLIEIRDNSPNHVARIRAVEMIDARAGVIQEAGPAMPSVVILGQNITVSTVRGTELDALLRAAAAKAGPSFQAIVDAKLDGKVVDAAPSGAVAPADSGSDGGRSGGASP